ncbi:hypothetical protein B0H34DRAFT_670856 [Crassisporium funariophilum]|nr:hypothetical protein B0H34DRAFT_670856 [Crassisporium funariophilum]
MSLTFVLAPEDGDGERGTTAIPSLLPSDVVAPTLGKVDTHEPTINGYHRSDKGFITFTPISTFETAVASPSSTSTNVIRLATSWNTDSRGKKELLEPPMSHLSASGPAVLKPPSPSNRPSHEDGEIEASPPSAPYRPLASSVRPFPPKSRLFTTTNFVSPQSHSPPTGPHSSFLPSSGSPTPTFNGGGSTYRAPCNIPPYACRHERYYQPSGAAEWASRVAPVHAFEQAGKHSSK